MAASYCLRIPGTPASRFRPLPGLILITLPLGYWRGMVTADNAYDGTIAFWQSLIAGITVVSLLVFLRAFTVRCASR